MANVKGFSSLSLFGIFTVALTVPAVTGENVISKFALSPGTIVVELGCDVTVNSESPVKVTEGVPVNSRSSVPTLKMANTWVSVAIGVIAKNRGAVIYHNSVQFMDPNMSKLEPSGVTVK